MEFSIERDNGQEIVIEDASDDLLSRLEREYLDCVTKDYPNYKEKVWEYTPTEFTGMDMPRKFFENSPAALKEYDENNRKKLKSENDLTQEMTLITAIVNMMRFKNAKNDFKFDEMKKVHKKFEEFNMLKHQANKNQILSEFAKQKIDSTLKQNGLDTLDKVNKAMEAVGKGTLNESVQQLDAAVKEVVHDSGKIETFMFENKELPSFAKSDAFSAIEKAKEMMSDLTESIIKNSSALIEGLCSLLTGGRGMGMRS